MDDFDEARDLVKVRLYPDEHVAAGHPMVARPLAESVVEALVLDRPTHVMTLAGDQPEKWGLTPDELFEIGFANVRREVPPAIQRIDAEPSAATIFAAVGDSFFTTTWVRWLDELTEIPAEGALVGLPHRHTILIHPIRDLSVLSAVQHVITGTRLLYERGPGSLSRHVYWWRRGSLRWLPSSLEEDRIELRPPEDFTAMLERLSGPA